MKYMKRIFIPLVAVLILSVVAIAHAQTVPTSTNGTGTIPGDSQTISLPNPLTGADTFTGLLHKIVTWMIEIGAPIATLMIIVGAFQMVFAAGDPDKFATGRKTILYTVIGYGIILIGWGFVTIIQDVLSL